MANKSNPPFTRNIMSIMLRAPWNLRAASRSNSPSIYIGVRACANGQFRWFTAQLKACDARHFKTQPETDVLHANPGEHKLITVLLRCVIAGRNGARSHGFQKRGAILKREGGACFCHIINKIGVTKVCFFSRKMDAYTNTFDGAKPSSLCTQ